MFVTTQAGEKLRLSGDDAFLLGQPKPNNGDVVVYLSADAKARFSAITSAMLTTGLSSPPPIGNVTPNTGAFTTLSATGTVDFAAGTVGTPSLRFGGDTTSGLWRPAANQVGVSISGVNIITVATAGLTVNGTWTSSGDGDVGLAAGVASILNLGRNPTGNKNSIIRFLGSNSQTNWQLSHNSYVSGAFEITPSTAGGGTTFSTPVITLSTTGLAVTGAISATTTITPGQTQGIVGTTTNNNAQAGSVGEYIESVIASGSAVSLTTATAANVTSISLTAGDWDVWGVVYFSQGATTLVTEYDASIGSTTATLGTSSAGTLCIQPGTNSAAVLVLNTLTPPAQRFSLSGTTTIYLVAMSVFTVSTCSAYGALRARRRR